MTKPRKRSLPLWKEEISIHAAEEAYVSRRQLAKFMVLTSVGMFVGNAWIAAKAMLRGEPSPPPVRRVAGADLRPGEVRLFAYPGEDDACILVRTRSGQLAAFGQKCPHLSCAVLYSRQSDHLYCPCHDGAFSAKTGAVLYGPPPRALSRIRIEERAGSVYALGFLANTEEV